MDVVHSLFFIRANEYEEAPPELWGVVDEIPREDVPTLTKLNSVRFVENTTFTGTSPSEFEFHVTIFHSINPLYFDSSAH